MEIESYFQINQALKTLNLGYPESHQQKLYQQIPFKAFQNQFEVEFDWVGEV